MPVTFHDKARKQSVDLMGNLPKMFQEAKTLKEQLAVLKMQTAMLEALEPKTRQARKKKESLYP